MNILTQLFKVNWLTEINFVSLIPMLCAAIHILIDRHASLAMTNITPPLARWSDFIYTLDCGKIEARHNVVRINA